MGAITTVLTVVGVTPIPIVVILGPIPDHLRVAMMTAINQLLSQLKRLPAHLDHPQGLQRVLLLVPV